MLPENEKYIYANEDEAKKAIVSAIKEYELVTEKYAISTKIIAICVAYYDEKGQIQGLQKAGVFGFPPSANGLYEDLGDVVAVFCEKEFAVGHGN